MSALHSPQFSELRQHKEMYTMNHRLLAIILLCYAFGNGGASKTPEQIHLALGDPQTDMVVNWITFEPCPSFVRLRTGNEPLQTVPGTWTAFKNGGGMDKTMRYVHTVTLSGLKPGQLYSYDCGDGEEIWSDINTFYGPNPQGSNPKFIIFGDLGVVNGLTIPMLNHDVTSSPPDAVIHIGDIAYEMYEQDGAKGDTFMKMIEPAASAAPYMVQVGNHEWMYNFTHYKERFSMPGDSDNYFYSWNYGPIHFVAVSTEVYFFEAEGGTLPITNQWNWLVKDLQEANTPEQRKIRPWVIAYGHRQMYCSGIICRNQKAAEDSTKSIPEDQVVREAFEKIFYENGVDLEFWGHWHVYERTWPMYNFTVYNSTGADPYTNARAPIHIVTGAAGMFDKNNCFPNKPVEWSAARSSAYSYTKFSVANETSLYFEQVAIAENGSSTDSQIIDSFYITKTKQNNFP